MDGGALLRPGAARHSCEWPRLRLDIRHGAIWRCECGRRWRLDVTVIGPHSRSGRWRRWYWPWT